MRGGEEEEEEGEGAVGGRVVEKGLGGEEGEERAGEGVHGWLLLWW